MTHSYALSAVGTDEPGIIAAITQALLDLDCNLADISMSVLSGHFAMVVMVQAPGPLSQERLEAELGRVTHGFQLMFAVQRLEGNALPRSASRRSPEEAAMVTVYGGDRPGIVHGVTQAIAGIQSNIVDLRTQCFNENSANYALFLEVNLAAGQSRDSLAAALHGVARCFGVQVQVQAVQYMDAL